MFVGVRMQWYEHTLTRCWCVVSWSTAGGFSFSTATPSYQKDVVEAYLTTHKDILPPAHLFNASGRAFPDVVTVGHNLNVVLGGKFVPTDGTSASAPIFAGIVSLLNQARASAGMPMVRLRCLCMLVAAVLLWFLMSQWCVYFSAARLCKPFVVPHRQDGALCLPRYHGWQQQVLLPRLLL